MSTAVSFTPGQLDFGAVSPGAAGPDITVDPSFGPPRISFAGAVQIKNVPVDAVVTARFAHRSVFSVRDIIALEWVWETVDPGELPPGHRGPLPKVRVLEVAAQAAGDGPLAVKQGQYLLVRAEYAAPADGGTFTDSLIISGDTWDDIHVPSSLFLSGLSSVVLNTPVRLAQGTATSINIDLKVLAGPNSTVRYEMSPTQLQSGVSIAGPNEFGATASPQTVSLKLRTALDAPLGDNMLAINQFFLNKRTAFFVPVTVDPFDTIQKIHALKIAPEPCALNFSFTTERPSRPTITLWKRISNDPAKDMVPANQIGQMMTPGLPRTTHAPRLSELPVAIPLWFRIDADVEDPEIPPGAFASWEGHTATLHRQCVAHVWRINVEQAGGDEDGPEDGNEMDFSMNVYDGNTGLPLIETTIAKFDSVDSGDVITGAFGANDGFVAIPGATDVIVPYIFAASQDPDLGIDGIGLMVPPKLPGQPSSGASERGAWADSFHAFRPPVAVGDTNSQAFVLATLAPSLVAFQATVTVETIVSDPYGALGMVYVEH
ncbi:hypothetical protein [Bradyrhizobium sp. UNPF46]|uniref:hypothetical protein n=1 Tax=Bradyrhizobium sp. UNPF46 TaxID=1141168 RepID=UPI0011512374|nr:hypothetical protein [Bradyrhizobium sp. UNPF46]